MAEGKPSYTQFRSRLKRREHLLGTFLKIPTTHNTEILGSIGFDFVIIDQEHAAFDRVHIDTMVLAARASNIAALVRVPEASPAAILTVLDLGATGVLVPHVDTAAKARQIVSACRYRGGSRGFAGTTRAGGFGAAGVKQHMDTQDAQVTCIAMIEDPGALAEIDQIARVEGLDAFFIGRGDLTASLGCEKQEEAPVREVVEKITAAARAADMPVVVLPSNRGDAVAMRKLGASAFIISNDQNLMKSAATQALKDFAPPIE